MFNVLTEINWLAVLASTVVFAVLGGLYFSVIVAKPYAIALGNEHKELPKPGPIFIVGPLISSLVVVITSAVLLKALSVESLGDGIAFGLIVGIGYLVAQTFNIAINPNFPRPILYGLINAPYFIICAVVASIILTLWH
jgi:heme/copper-type cytochrome/quinol oxidase subunit 3